MTDIRQLDTADAITAKLVQLIKLCEQRSIDVDLIWNEARRIASGTPYFGT